MGKRIRPKSTDTFESEVRTRFGPLAAEWGMDDPVEDGFVLPAIDYTGGRLTYSWMLDPQDGQLSVSVRLVVTGGTLRSWLEDLVVGAGLGVAQDVRQSARTWHSLQLAIDSHVAWLARLHPILSQSGGEEFLERAGARRSTPDLK
jgi:hypothetical protein